jgi:sialate O-acetylesterase
MKKILKALFSCYLLFLSIHTEATITLPKIFSDNMVLQRDKPLKIWGWAAKGENVTVNFNGQKLKSKAVTKSNYRIETYVTAFKLVVFSKEVYRRKPQYLP